MSLTLTGVLTLPAAAWTSLPLCNSKRRTAWMWGCCGTTARRAGTGFYATRAHGGPQMPTASFGGRNVSLCSMQRLSPAAPRPLRGRRHPARKCSPPKSAGRHSVSPVFLLSLVVGINLWAFNSLRLAGRCPAGSLTRSPNPREGKMGVSESIPVGGLRRALPHTGGVLSPEGNPLLPRGEGWGPFGKRTWGLCFSGPPGAELGPSPRPGVLPDPTARLCRPWSLLQWCVPSCLPADGRARSAHQEGSQQPQGGSFSSTVIRTAWDTLLVCPQGSS